MVRVSPWSTPLAGSSTGAAHRRRGQPCQDASLVAHLEGPRGEPLTLLAVADGHGAAAYRHSAVGSALACQVARRAVAEALAAPGGGTLAVGPPPGWLERELPAAIHRHWLAAIRSHWASLDGEGGTPFEPRPYGTTLGLVLLAPRWWGHTGLGDWDLVRIDAAGARLLSQEEADGERGEATASLGLPQGRALAEIRAAHWPLQPAGAPFALVLSTDGMRKSCASDGDFLALAAWLATGMEAAALAESLERISAEGCGDDVSVALARWGGLERGPTADPADMGASSGSEGAPMGGGTLPAAGWERHGHGDRGHNAEPPGPVGPPAAAVPRPAAGPRARLAALGLLGLAVAGGGALLGLQRIQPGGAPPGLPALLEAEARRLCGSPGLARAELRNRRSQFEGLQQGRLGREALLAQAARDPLGALIAAHVTPPGSPPAPAGLGAPAGCPELEATLRSLGEGGASPGGSAGPSPTASSPPTPGPAAKPAWAPAASPAPPTTPAPYRP